MSKQGRRTRQDATPDPAAPWAGRRSGETAFQAPQGHACSVLEEITRAREHVRAVEDQIAEMVGHARGEHRITWDELGEAMGVTRQAARQRYGQG